MAECTLHLADGIGNLDIDVDSSVEEEWGDLEPFFFDEALVVAEHAAAKGAGGGARNTKRAQAHLAALDKIREFDPKHNRFYFTRFDMVDLSVLDLDEESPHGPMRYTDTYTEVSTNGYGRTICNQGSKWFMPSYSANVLSVKIVSSSAGFPVDVYGSVIARDTLDRKCVYLFRCDRDHCQLISSVDESLTLVGPKRELVLQGHIYFELDLKIKGGQGQDDKQFSKGFLMVDGIQRRTREKMVVESDYLHSKLSTVEVTFAVVKRAAEATIAFEVLHGEFNGNITAENTSIRDSRLVLYDSQADGVRKGVNQPWRPVVAVCVEEMLRLNIVEVNGISGEIEHSIVVEFKPAVNGRREAEVTCGSCTLLVKIAWSIIAKDY